MNFYNLKVFTDYSTKSSIKMDNLISNLQENNQDAVGVVDLSTLSYINKSNIKIIYSTIVELCGISCTVIAKTQLGLKSIVRLSYSKNISHKLSLYNNGTILIASKHNDKFDIWGEDYYLEISPRMNHIKMNVENFESSRQLVCTNDTYYLTKKDYFTHIKYYNDEPESWLKNKKEILNSAERFCLHIPYKSFLESVENTSKIVEKCDIVSFQMDLMDQFMPIYNIPKQIDKYEYLKHLVMKKAEDLDDIYLKRIEYELGLYKDKNFVDYVLIIYDIVQHHPDIMFNLRGSSVASLVLYILGVSKIDPIKHKLIFERFLNENRDENPDIDLECPHEKREMLVQYLKGKYGNNNVLEMGVFIKWGEANKDIPEVIRRVSKHPSGVVVSGKSLRTTLPIIHYNDRKLLGIDNKNIISHLGKFDILSSITLSIIDSVFKEENITFEDVDFDDPKIFRKFSKGFTNQVFQFESDIARKILMDVQPKSFDELVVCCALNRPAMISSKYYLKYAQIKRKELPEEYICPELKPILRSTYSIPIFQEQIMKIVSTITGQSLAGADEFRRLITNKNENDDLEELKNKFVRLSIKNGIDKQKAIEVYKFVETFSKYGFNQSHSVSYSFISYITMWLKTYYKTTYEKIYNESK